jgi:hypothetical protein
MDLKNPFRLSPSSKVAPSLSHNVSGEDHNRSGTGDEEPSNAKWRA